MTFYNLPCYDSRKSFYGKALVIEYDNGEKHLKSYDTIVFRIDPDGGLHRLWSGYSATTIRHINSFLQHFGHPHGGKAFWDSLPVEDLYDALTALDRELLEEVPAV